VAPEVERKDNQHGEEQPAWIQRFERAGVHATTMASGPERLLNGLVGERRVGREAKVRSGEIQGDPDRIS
jgi:hypothetical protein